LLPRSDLRPVPARPFEPQNPAIERAPPISSLELVELLQNDGAQLVALDDRGSFLRVRHHLLFVRRAVVVDAKDLRDTLRMAAVGPGRFDRLLAQVRRRGHAER
jgi:hypothetical protein